MGPAPAQRSALPERPPNILLIVADDLGWNDVGYHGSRIRTPHLDGLAARAVELDQHYVQPLCSPTRAALLTGRYPSRFGPHALGPTNRRALPLGTPTLASVLRERGYFTAIAGKWHLGSRPEWGPNHYGFARSYGLLTGAGDPWTHQYREGPYADTWHRDLEPLQEEGNLTELVAAQVLEWIETPRSEPWLVYVPFTAVHIPIDAPQRYLDEYRDAEFYEDPQANESFQRYAAFVSQLDDKVGSFLAALDRTEQRENTIVVFFSDNGGLPGGGNAYISEVPPAPVAASNAPLRGRKGQLYEGGIRVPALIAWPGRLEPRRVRTPLHVVDWLPTLAGLVGLEPAVLPERLDGRDAGAALRGEPADLVHRVLYWPFRQSAAVRAGGWKLITTWRGETPKHQLFDLDADPAEAHDLAETEPQTLARLVSHWQALREDDVTEVPADLVGVSER